jgi:hypothetical protein
MNQNDKKTISEAFNSDEALIQQSIQDLIDVEILLEILTQRKARIVERLKKRLEEELDGNRSRSLVQ